MALKFLTQAHMITKTVLINVTISTNKTILDFN